MKKMNNKSIKFLRNVSKLSWGGHSNEIHDEKFGNVRIVTEAADARNGRRVFSVSKSQVIPSGKYSFAGLRERIAR
jgi:hypothetical protein